MEYYLVQCETLTGVVESTVGFTPDMMVVERERAEWLGHHVTHKGFVLEDQECASCDVRFVVTPIYPFN